MIKLTNLLLPIKYTDDDIRNEIKRKLKIGDYDILSFEVIKDSIDAHKRGEIHRCVSVGVSLRGEKRFYDVKGVEKYEKFQYEYPPVSRLEKRPVVVGSGPAGLFAAHILAVCGARPILIERGMDVDARQKAVKTFFLGGKLDTECNIQFGEGGAGTFSDGKLTTRINDPLCEYIMERLAFFGVPDETLKKAKPHIGTDKLRIVVKNIRQEIIRLGGEVRFGVKLDGITLKNGSVSAISVGGQTIPAQQLVLAIGHSARDTFEMLMDQQIPMTVSSIISHKQEIHSENVEYLTCDAGHTDILYDDDGTANDAVIESVHRFLVRQIEK